MCKTFSKCTKTMYCKVQIKVCWHWSFFGKKHYKKIHARQEIEEKSNCNWKYETTPQA